MLQLMGELLVTVDAAHTSTVYTQATSAVPNGVLASCACCPQVQMVWLASTSREQWQGMEQAY